MKLIQFLHKSRFCIGAEITPGASILDLSRCITGFPNDMVSLLKQGEPMMEKAKQVLRNISDEYVLKHDDVQILAPVLHPDKVICIGMNYKDLCEEQGFPIPKEPVVFSKFPSSIVGPYDDIPYPAETQKLDWEVELAIIIGKAGKQIKVEDAASHIAGYTVAHDVSARDCQLERNGGQWLLGKAMDAFCPLGPALVTRDSIADVGRLSLSCKVNGVVKQVGSTKEMVFDCATIVAYLSRFFTLTPGDVILTGSPPGVGVFRKPAEYLKRGDVVECSIEDIGTLKNRIT